MRPSQVIQLALDSGLYGSGPGQEEHLCNVIKRLFEKDKITSIESIQTRRVIAGKMRDLGEAATWSTLWSNATACGLLNENIYSWQPEYFEWANKFYQDFIIELQAQGN